MAGWARAVGVRWAAGRSGEPGGHQHRSAPAASAALPVTAQARRLLMADRREAPAQPAFAMEHVRAARAWKGRCQYPAGVRTFVTAASGQSLYPQGVYEAMLKLRENRREFTMLGYLSANWIWILLIGGMLVMHLGHGRHGHGHGGGGGGCGGHGASHDGHEPGMDASGAGDHGHPGGSAGPAQPAPAAPGPASAGAGRAGDRPAAAAGPGPAPVAVAPGRARPQRQ